MKKLAIRIIPWVITAVALYFAFRGVEFSALLNKLYDADKSLLLLAFSITCFSYVIRARRWQYLFVRPTITFIDSARVLMLGFFMNNILPARTGEFVRAHAGAKVSGESTTSVFATVVSERLIDGLTLSLFFVIFARHVGDAQMSKKLFLVACLFAAVAIGVFAMLLTRSWIFRLLDLVHARIQTRVTEFIVHRVTAFLNGLAPLFSARRLPAVVLSSVAVWSLEFSVYICITTAYHAHLTLSGCMLFMVALNFSSLVPAAPGGAGVIEAFTTTALTSLGLDKTLALSMVITQHLSQYIAVGIPGALAMATWKGNLKKLESEIDLAGEPAN